MHTVTVIDQSSARRLPPLQPSPEAFATYPDPVSEMDRDTGTDDAGDTTVLLMALEELELRRAALERLLDEGLLCCCLV